MIHGSGLEFKPGSITNGVTRKFSRKAGSRSVSAQRQHPMVGAHKRLGKAMRLSHRRQLAAYQRPSDELRGVDCPSESTSN